MDLGAYTKIDDYGQIMRDNGISVPRLRGIRLMKEETPLSEKEIADEALFMGLHDCQDLCRSDFIPDANWSEYSSKTKRIIRHYMLTDKDVLRPNGINWNVLHGRKRKLFKFTMKKADKRVRKVYEAFNKYCGRDDVLYIHARIGGLNWGYFGGDEIAKQPWFIEKVDDAFDCTYCDIYARIKAEE